VGRGATGWLAPNDDPLGRARNRRVAVTVLAGGGAA
jgi:chemotaxis protein MotB